MYAIDIMVDGRWITLNGRFQSEDEANRKIDQYQRCSSTKAPKFYRVRRVG